MKLEAMAPPSPAPPTFPANQAIKEKLLLCHMDLYTQIYHLWHTNRAAIQSFSENGECERANRDLSEFNWFRSVAIGLSRIAPVLARNSPSLGESSKSNRIPVSKDKAGN